MSVIRWYLEAPLWAWQHPWTFVIVPAFAAVIVVAQVIADKLDR